MKYQQAQEMLENENYEDVYKYFDEIIKNGTTDWRPYFWRANLGGQFEFQTIEDSERDVMSALSYAPKKACNFIYPLAINIKNAMEKYDDAILYQQKINTSKMPPEMAKAVALELCRAHWLRENRDNDDAMYCYFELKRLLAEEPDDESELLKQFLEVNYFLNRYDACLNIIDRLFELGQVDEVLYNYKAGTLYSMASTPEGYEKALDAFEVCLKYDEKNLEACHNKIICLIECQRYEEAEKFIDKIYSETKDQDFELLKAYMYDKQGLVEKSIAAARKIDTLRAKQTTIQLLIKTRDEKHLIEAKNMALKIYQEEDEFFALTIYKDICFYLNKIDELEKIVNERLQLEKAKLKENNNNDTRYDIDFLLDIKLDCERHHSTIYNTNGENIKLTVYDILNNNGYNELYQLGTLLYSSELDKTDLMLIKKVVKKSPTYLDERQIANLYLYGVYPFKTNHKWVMKYISKINLDLVKVSCVATMIGRAYEIIKNDKQRAYQCYKRAYEITDVNDISECDCSIAYYAHALYNDFGTRGCQSEAFDLIKQELISHNYSQSNNCVFLYAYFALKGIEGFDIQIAVDHLLESMTDGVYDIDNCYLLMKCYQHLKNEKEVVAYKQFIEKNINYFSILQKKYYKIHQNESLIYPLLNNR